MDLDESAQRKNIDGKRRGLRPGSWGAPAVRN